MRKRLLTFLFALVAVAAGAWAEDSYSVQLGDIKLPNVSNDNITGDCITHGKASFDVDTYTLTLDNVTIENVNNKTYFSGLSYYAYGAGTPDLTIKLIGKNNLPGIDVWHDETRNGKVTIVGADPSASVVTDKITDYMTDLYFSGCTVTVTTEGIRATDSQPDLGCTFSVDNATLDLTEKSGGMAIAMMGMSSQLILGEGIGIIDPEGGVFGSDPDGRWFTVFTGEDWMTWASHVVIGPKAAEQVTKYNLVVGGVQVTSENAANITGPGITAGKAFYDPATSTLTLDNVHFDMSNLWNWDGIQDATNQGTSIGVVAIDGVDVNAMVNDLTINLVGTNISEDRGHAVRFFENVTITSADGTGVLKAPDADANQCGIEQLGNVTFSNCYVRSNFVHGVDNITVTDGATLEAHDVGWYENITFGEGIGIVEPVDAKIDYKEYLGYSILNADGSEPSNIIIGPKTEKPVIEYSLAVGGVRVTSENAGNITGEHITSGMAHFNEETGTLTLRSTVIEEVTAIELIDGGTKIPNLTVNLIGTNVSKSYETGIYAWQWENADGGYYAADQPNVRFTSDNGEGEMIFYRPDWDNAGEWTLGSLWSVLGTNDFTIDHCVVRTGGINGGGGVLTITNGGTLETEGIDWFSDLVFGEGIGFITPATGAVYHGKSESSDMNNWYLEYTGDEKFDTYVIGPKEDIPVEVEAVKTAGNSAATYNMQGMRVERPAKGLYIKDGRKVVVK